VDAFESQLPQLILSNILDVTLCRPRFLTR
jgi:hypothetical protein